MYFTILPQGVSIKSSKGNKQNKKPKQTQNSERRKHYVKNDRNFLIRILRRIRTS